MKGFSAIALLLFVASCASLPGQNSLYAIYADYKASANQGNILDVYTHYFSPRLVAEDEPDESAIPFLLFKDEMGSEGRHFEAMESQDAGCLTVEGFGRENGDPLEFNIRYVKVDGQWYMDGTHIRFLESVEEFSGEAVCP